jgi:hypothetical protein
MSKNPAKSRVVGVLPKAPDLECHVRVIEVENVRVAEFRDYIPSLEEYGRGYWLPMSESALYGAINAITEIINSETLEK